MKEIHLENPLSFPTQGLLLSFVLGLPFVGFGIFVTLLGLDIIKLDNLEQHAPSWVIAFFGLAFLSAGLSVIVRSVRRKFAIDERKKLRLKHPASPWIWDYPWDPRGFREAKHKRMLTSGVFAMILFVIIAPFNWVAWIQLNELIPRIVTGVFDGVFIAILVTFFYRFLQFRKYGNTFARYAEFPFALGKSLNITLEGVPRRESIQKLHVELRCLQEHFRYTGSGKSRRLEVVAFVLHSERREIDVSELGSSRQLPLQFPLPESANLTSDLGKNPARYWEIVVEAETTGIDFNANYLVPVY